ncbi:hypothetical protein R84B8_02167 [Treponema sp. R8-4-B8]
MPQNQTMTLDEKLATGCRAVELKKAGDRDGYYRLMETIPIPPYIAKVIKEKMGAEYLTGRNLSEAEAEFGPDWLSK